MTTEVDFSLTLQLAGSHLRQWLVLGFFRLRKEKVPVEKKKGKKGICQPVNFIYSRAASELSF